MNKSRNLVGYGQKDFKIEWPNKAKIAVQFVLNYEEGGENCVLNGDKYSCLLYTSPSPRDGLLSRMPSSA